MGPPGIIKQAREQGIDIIAITDHNSAKNVKAVVDSAKGTGISVIPGIEVSTNRDAHIICLFPDLAAVQAFEAIINPTLASGKNDPEFFGPQYVVDADENILEECDELLSLPTQLNIKQIAKAVTTCRGLLYPAHVDRRSNSFLRVTGFVPSELPVVAVEISRFVSAEQVIQEWPDIAQYSIMQSSDAHDLKQIGTGITWFKLAAPTFEEIVLALKAQGGRKVSLALPME